MNQLTIKQPKLRLRAQAVQIDSRWKAEEAAAWEALKGIWADRKLDAVGYQRDLRRERRMSKR